MSSLVGALITGCSPMAHTEATGRAEDLCASLGRQEVTRHPDVRLALYVTRPDTPGNVVIASNDATRAGRKSGGELAVLKSGADFRSQRRRPFRSRAAPAGALPARSGAERSLCLQKWHRHAHAMDAEARSPRGALQAADLAHAQSPRAGLQVDTRIRSTATRSWTPGAASRHHHHGVPCDTSQHYDEIVASNIGRIGKKADEDDPCRSSTPASQPRSRRDPEIASKRS